MPIAEFIRRQWNSACKNVDPFRRQQRLFLVGIPNVVAERAVGSYHPMTAAFATMFMLQQVAANPTTRAYVAQHSGQTPVGCHASWWDLFQQIDKAGLQIGQMQQWGEPIASQNHQGPFSCFPFTAIKPRIWTWSRSRTDRKGMTPDDSTWRESFSVNK